MCKSKYFVDDDMIRPTPELPQMPPLFDSDLRWAGALACLVSAACVVAAIATCIFAVM